LEEGEGEGGGLCQRRGIAKVEDMLLELGREERELRLGFGERGIDRGRVGRAERGHGGGGEEGRRKELEWEKRPYC